MICLVCSHRYYLPHCCPCGLQWYPIYLQTKAFSHIATHTDTHTHTRTLASSPLCLAGMLMNEWSLVVIPYLWKLNTDGVFWGGGLNKRNSIYRSEHNPVFSYPDILLRWAGAFPVRTVETESPNPPPAPVNALPASSLLYEACLWGWVDVSSLLRGMKHRRPAEIMQSNMHLALLITQDKKKKCFCWVVCQLLRAHLIVSKPFTSQQARGADDSLIFNPLFLPEGKESSAINLKK